MVELFFAKKQIQSGQVTDPFKGRRNEKQSKTALIDSIKYLASHVGENVTEELITKVEKKLEEERMIRMSDLRCGSIINSSSRSSISLANHITEVLKDPTEHTNLTLTEHSMLTMTTPDFKAMFDDDSIATTDSFNSCGSDNEDYVRNCNLEEDAQNAKNDNNVVGNKVEGDLDERPYKDSIMNHDTAESFVVDIDIGPKTNQSISTESDSDSESDISSCCTQQNKLVLTSGPVTRGLSDLSLSQHNALSLSQHKLPSDMKRCQSDPSFSSLNDSETTANRRKFMSNQQIRRSKLLGYDEEQDNIGNTTHSCRSELIRGFSYGSMSHNPKMKHSLSFSNSAAEPVIKLRQNRIQRISQISKTSSAQAEDASTSRGSTADTTTMLTQQSHEDEIRAARKSRSALLFVDISGFTMLAKSLEIEPFSKVINNYFQMIVEEIEECGGDILKFAGDALMAEWKAPSLAEKPIHYRRNNKPSSVEDAVVLASTCAARLVDKGSDFPVIANDVEIAKLNLHCGIGFGMTTGVHVGNSDRMEYLILGESIQQCAEAVNVAKLGEVAISKEAMEIFSRSVLLLDEAKFEGDGEMISANGCDAKIIASKSERFFQHKPGFVINHCDDTFLERIVQRCKVLSNSSLELLQKELLPYVHPVLFGDFSNNDVEKISSSCGSAGNNNNNDCSKDEKLVHESEAELRNVVTLFIQPKISVHLPGNEDDDIAVCDRLNQVMILVNSEVTRFKGQLRQFIVDDKGLVIIANFGLRGSTFPNMIEERAMPCLKAVKNLMKAELDAECKIGATYGKAYCGVVGGTFRHEYAILGRSVNLAARLMTHTKNPGILANQEVVEKAGGYPFDSLPPVLAKGYNEPVNIYKPQDSIRKTFEDLRYEFIGRKDEIRKICTSAESAMLSGELSYVVFITGQYGIGKSALLYQASKIIQADFESRSIQCDICRHTFCDDDSYRPFSFVRHLFLNLLLKRNEKSQAPQIDSSPTVVHEAQLYVRFLQLCMEAGIPGEYMELLGGLIFTNELSEIGRWSDRGEKMSEWTAIAMYVVQAFQHCYSNDERMILLALDDVSGMDEMSWKIISLLYEHAQYLVVIGTFRNHYDLNIHTEFWDVLWDEKSIKSGRFTPIDLSPFDQVEVNKLVEQVLGEKREQQNQKISNAVYKKSEGNPLLASEILEKLYRENNWLSSRNIGDVGEVLLNRLDSLSQSARSYLNLGALLGSSFKLLEIVAVMGRYYHVAHTTDPHVESSFTVSVRERLNEAVELGIVDISEDDTNIYSFSHQFWRENILARTLDSWKSEMRALIMDIEEKKRVANNYNVQRKAKEIPHDEFQFVGKKNPESVKMDDSPDLKNTAAIADDKDPILVLQLQALNSKLAEIEHDIRGEKQKIVDEKNVLKQQMVINARNYILGNIIKDFVQFSGKNIVTMQSEACKFRANTKKVIKRVHSLKQSNSKLYNVNSDCSRLIRMLRDKNEMLEKRHKRLYDHNRRFEEAISSKMNEIQLCMRRIAQEKEANNRYASCFKKINEQLRIRCSDKELLKAVNTLSLKVLRKARTKNVKLFSKSEPQVKGIHSYRTKNDSLPNIAHHITLNIPNIQYELDRVDLPATIALATIKSSRQMEIQPSGKKLRRSNPSNANERLCNRIP